MNDEIISQDTLKDIFYGHYPASVFWDSIDELYIAIHTDAIVYSYEQIAPIAEYHRLIERSIPSEGLGHQGAGHMALKQIGIDWLQQSKHVLAVQEAPFCGFHPDVASVDHRFILECGTTDAGSIAVYLADSTVSQAGNIAYPFADDTEICFHIFQRGPKFYDWQLQKVSKLRDVFRNFKK